MQQEVLHATLADGMSGKKPRAEGFRHPKSNAEL
jgi:hypothetical protein